MVKSPPKPPTEMAKPTTAVAKPAASPWPTQQKVTDLARMLDYDYPYCEAMLKLLEQLEKATNYPASYPTRKMIIQEAEKLIENFEKMGGRSGVRDGRLQKLWDECSPESWWPEDRDSPVYSEVAKMVAVLMGSFPTSKIPEPEIFVRVLLDDVMALDPTFVEMEATCRHLRKTKKFMPSISEVIETLQEQQEIWCRRRSPLWFLEDNYNDLRAEIAKAKAAEEAEIAKAKAAEERKAAKSQPIVIGDRVRNPKAGVGTVTAIEQYTPEIASYRVRFDTDTSRTVYSGGLERLIARDVGFEPPAVPMIEHRKDVPMPLIASSPVRLDANGDKVGIPADRSRETRNGEDD